MQFAVTKLFCLCMDFTRVIVFSVADRQTDYQCQNLRETQLANVKEKCL